MPDPKNNTVPTQASLPLEVPLLSSVPETQPSQEKEESKKEKPKVTNKQLEGSNREISQSQDPTQPSSPLNPWQSIFSESMDHVPNQTQSQSSVSLLDELLEKKW